MGGDNAHRLSGVIAASKYAWPATQATPAGAIFNTLAHERFGCDFKC